MLVNYKMICPKCNVTALIIQNNNYYCPGCRIYIGSVATYKPSPPVIIDKPIIDRGAFFKHYINKTLTYLVIIFVVVFFTKDLFYFDISKGCYFFITPSMNLEFSNSGIKRALGIIKIISPENYQNICARVNIINTNLCDAGFEGGCFYSGQSRTIYVAATPRKITWVAEVLAHEACHARQKYEGRPGDEQECWKVGLKVMQDATVY